MTAEEARSLLDQMAAHVMTWQTKRMLNELVLFGCVALQDGRITTYEQMVVDNPATPCDTPPVPSVAQATTE